MTTLPDFVDLVLTRMALCWAEISGITRVYKYAPSQTILDGDLPAVFPFGVGGSQTLIPNRNAGQITMAREYRYALLVTPLSKAGLDTGNTGAYEIELVAPFIMRVYEYFISHPGLSTSTLTDLTYMNADVLLRENGVSIINGAGGAQYAGVVFTFTVEQKARLTPSAIS